MSVADRYPLMTAGMEERRVARFEEAVDALLAGAEEGAIRKVIYDDAKRTLGDAVYKGFDNVRGPYFHGGRWESLPEDVRNLDEKLGIPSSLHDVLALHKRLSKTTVEHPVVDAMKRFAAEALPLAEAAAALKDKLVKGRVVNPEGPAKPVNPNKVIGTCPCCSRGIAVTGGTMAHHGYERPGTGYQTDSCAGIRFKPLEVSSEGLAWLVETTQQHLDQLRKTYEGRESIRSLVRIDRRNQRVEVTPDMPEWRREFASWVATTERDIRWLESDLERLEPMLRDWKPNAEWIAANGERAGLGGDAMQGQRTDVKPGPLVTAAMSDDGLDGVGLRLPGDWTGKIKTVPVVEVPPTGLSDLDEVEGAASEQAQVVELRPGDQQAPHYHRVYAEREDGRYVLAFETHPGFDAAETSQFVRELEAYGRGKQEAREHERTAISKLVELHQQSPRDSALSSWQNLRRLAEERGLGANIGLVEATDGPSFRVAYTKNGQDTAIESTLYANGKAVTTHRGERQPGTGPTADAQWQADQFAHALAREEGPSGPAVGHPAKAEIVRRFGEIAVELGVSKAREQEVGEQLFESMVRVHTKIEKESAALRRLIGGRAEKKSDPEASLCDWMMERSPEVREIIIRNNTRPYVPLYIDDELEPSSPNVVGAGPGP